MYLSSKLFSTHIKIPNDAYIVRRGEVSFELKIICTETSLQDLVVLNY